MSNFRNMTYLVEIYQKRISIPSLAKKIYFSRAVVVGSVRESDSLLLIGDPASHLVPCNIPPTLKGQNIAGWCKRGWTLGGQTLQVDCVGWTSTMTSLLSRILRHPCAAV